RRQEAAQSAHALDLANLIGDALFKMLIELADLFRALAQLAQQPRVLNGDYAWSAKPFIRSRSLSWKGSTSPRVTIITPIALPSRDSDVNTCDRTGSSRKAAAIAPRSLIRTAWRSSIGI